MMVRCEDIIHPPEPRKRDSGRTDASSLFTREVITLPCKGMNTAPPERACHSTRISEQYYVILYSVVPHSVVCTATDLTFHPIEEMGTVFHFDAGHDRRMQRRSFVVIVFRSKWTHYSL